MLYPPADPREPGERWFFHARAGEGRFAAADLTEADARELAAAWEWCSPELGPESQAALDSLPAAPARRRRQQGWANFHEELVHAATRAAIGAGGGTAVMLHGAALAHPKTRAAIALVAASGTGKTTATLQLGRVLEYLTDETVIVAPDRTLVPYPKPLSLLPESGIRPKRQFSPAELGLRPSRGQATLRRVAVLDRDRRTTAVPTPPSARPLPLSEAIELLAPQSSSLARLPRGLCRLAELLDACGGALRLRYTEAATLAGLVEELLLDQPLRPLDTWEPEPLDATARDAAPGPGDYVRAPVDDAIAISDVFGESVAVLRGERLTLLRGLGPLLWREAARVRNQPQLHAAVVRAYGEHPEGQRLLSEQLAALVEHGLLLTGHPS